MNTLGRLPPELLPLILKHVNKKDLGACKFINRAFYEAAIPFVWRRLVINSELTFTNMVTHMTTSAFSQGQAVQDVTVKCVWSDVDLPAFTPHVPHLERLRLADIYPKWSNERLLDQIIALAIGGLQQLTDLKVETDYVDLTPLVTMVWPHLTFVRLAPCLTLDDTLAINFIQAHPRLQYLDWSGTKVTDRTLDAIARSLPSISCVSVAFSPGITAAGIYRLVISCATLALGVYCEGCGIRLHDPVFPPDLNKGGYELDTASMGEMDYGQYEISMLCMDAFEHTDDSEDEL